jgi:hypothetical protein
MTDKKRRRKPLKDNDETIGETYAKALGRLATLYGIEPGDNFSLLLRLARDHVRWFPRFKLQHGNYGGLVPDNKGGRKTDWTPEKLDELIADVDRAKKEHGFSADDEALRLIAQLPKWARHPSRDPHKRQKTLKNVLARARIIQRDTNRLLAKADRLLAKLSSNPEN